MSEDGTPEQIQVTIAAASVDTGVAQRDEHLRSADFFEADSYPTIEFRSTAIRPDSSGTLTLVGELTMHGLSAGPRQDLARPERNVHVQWRPTHLGDHDSSLRTPRCERWRRRRSGEREWPAQP